MFKEDNKKIHASIFETILQKSLLFGLRESFQKHLQSLKKTKKSGSFFEMYEVAILDNQNRLNFLVITSDRIF